MKNLNFVRNSLLAAILGLTTFHASAAWTVNGTFCQSNSDNGQMLLRIRPSTIGMIENKPQCNGRGAFALTSSNFGVNDVVYPSSVMCNSQTQYQAVQTTVATRDIQTIISTLKANKKVTVNTFGSAFTFNTADFARVCAAIINQNTPALDPQAAYKQDMEKMGYEQGQDGQWRKKSKPAY
ncbi:TPA: hypothetical protein U2R02_005044 [Klebsiella michiganensis]|nr:hypothetical protein [Klebsiella michiganensis]